MSEVNLFSDSAQTMGHSQFFGGPVQKIVRQPETIQAQAGWGCMMPRRCGSSQVLNQLATVLNAALSTISDLVRALLGKESPLSPGQSPIQPGYASGHVTGQQPEVPGLTERVSGWTEKGNRIIEGAKDLWSQGRDLFGSLGDALVGGLESAAPFVSSLPGPLGKIGGRIISGGLNLLKKIF